MKKQLIFIGNLIIVSVALLLSCKKDKVSIERPIFNSSLNYGTVTDIDGNTYKTITIGTQTWMAENLRTTKYNDSSIIQYKPDNILWSKSTSGAYCSYNNTNNNEFIATYGYLYNWLAVNTNKLAPEGWHIPSYNEWKTLIDYLGGESFAGGKMKEFGIIHWLNPNNGADNSSGFTALPSGYRYPCNGKFEGINSGTIYWSSTKCDETNAWHRNFDNEWTDAISDQSNYNFGFSVRCVKD